MYVAPNDRLARQARDKRKALYEAKIAAQKQQNIDKINSVHKEK